MTFYAVGPVKTGHPPQITLAACELALCWGGQGRGLNSNTRE